MIDEAEARSLATASLPFESMTLGDAREIAEGWFFPYRGQIGSNGVIINKQSGRAFQLGSAFPIERDLELYDRGWQWSHYDIVVLAIHNLDATRRAIGRLGLTTVTPSYEHGQVWRIAKSMTDLEIWKRLNTLPCIFPAVPLYFKVEVLEEARREGWFDFEAHEYRPKPSVG